MAIFSSIVSVIIFTLFYRTELTLIFTDYLDSPVGLMEIQASAQGLTRVEFAEAEANQIHGNEITTRCKLQLQQYFASERSEFDLPLDQQGTAFQKSIWNCLLTIPFGQTVSYGDIADMVNNRKAVRAVGAANGKNPISIIVPCHRVIGANQTLTGYAGGLERKAWLLKHEGAAFKNNEENQNSFQVDLFEA